MTNAEKLLTHLTEQVDNFAEENNMTSEEVLTAIINLLVAGVNRAAKGDPETFLEGMDWVIKFVAHVAEQQLSK